MAASKDSNSPSTASRASVGYSQMTHEQRGLKKMGLMARRGATGHSDGGGAPQILSNPHFTIWLSPLLGFVEWDKTPLQPILKTLYFPFMQTWSQIFPNPHILIAPWPSFPFIQMLP